MEKRQLFTKYLTVTMKSEKGWQGTEVFMRSCLAIHVKVGAIYGERGMWRMRLYIPALTRPPSS